MSETRLERKWFFVWDFDKEEEWLNAMAAEGWVLSDVGFCRYVFEKKESKAYSVRLEMHSPSDKEYMELLKESGVEFIGSVSSWIYLKKEGEFELFNDIDSKIRHLEGIGRMLLGVGLANIAIGLAVASHFGWLNLLLSAVTFYGLGRIHGRRDALEKERRIHE